MESETKNWEAGLDDIVNMTDANLELLAHERLRKSALPQFITNPKRATSVPRNLTSQRNWETGTSTADYDNNNNNNNNNNNDNNNNNERKVDLLLRRSKFMGDKIKQLEKETALSASSLTETRNELAQLIEFRKQDKKTIIWLKDQVSALKSAIESFKTVKNDKAHPFSNTETIVAPVITADADQTLKDTLVSSIKSEVYRDIKEWARVSLSEQTEVISKFIDRRIADDRKSMNSNQSSSLTDSEKEMLKLKSDFERIKLRQSSLDSVYGELREGVHIREKEAEDRHRRVISSHKLEMQNLVDSVSRKVNESIAAMEKSVVNLNIPEIRRQHDFIVVKLETFHHEVFSRLSAIELTQKEMIEQMRHYSSREYLNERLFGSDQSFSNQQFPLLKYREMLDEEVADSRLKIEHLHSQLSSLTHSCNQNHEKSTNQLHVFEQRLSDHQDDYKRTVEQLIEAGKKTRRKVKDISACVSDISTLGNKVDNILNHIDSRGIEESSTLNHATQSLKSMELRVLALENEVESVLQQGPGRDYDRLHSTVSTISSQISALEGKINGNFMNHSDLDLRLRSQIDEKFDGLQADINFQCLSMIQQQTAYLSDGIKRLEDTVVNLQQSPAHFNSAVVSFASTDPLTKENVDVVKTTHQGSSVDEGRYKDDRRWVSGSDSVVVDRGTDVENASDRVEGLPDSFRHQLALKKQNHRNNFRRIVGT